MSSHPGGVRHSFLHTALLGLLSLSLASLAITQGSRTVQNDPARPASDDAEVRTEVPAPAPTSSSPTLPGMADVTIIDAPEPESDVPYEITADPIPDSSGECSGTGPVPAYLEGNPYRLSFVNGDYVPSPGERVDPLLRQAQRTAGTKATTYGFVMFQGRITAAKQRRVAALGVKLLNFQTFQCFSAVIPFWSLPALSASKDVRWVGYARPEQKVDAAMAAAIGADAKGIREMWVTAFVPDAGGKPTKLLVSAPAGEPGGNGTQLASYNEIPNGAFQHALEADGAQVTGYMDELNMFVVKAPMSAVEKFVAHDFVFGVELTGRSQTLHDRSTRQIGIDRMRGASNSNGSGTICGLIDTGAWVRNSANPNGHLDLVKATYHWDYLNSGGALNDTVGHGTHVLGTFVGTGSVNNRYRGCAIGAGSLNTARLYIGKAIPGSFSAAVNAIKQFRVAVGGQPRPHVVNNSWGSTGTPPVAGYVGTDSTSREVDISSYTNNQLYVFAAGNSGTTGGYARDRLRSIGLPNVAKNAFTVANTYDWHGENSLGLNTTKTLNGSGLFANWFEADRVVPSSTYPIVKVTGFEIRCKSSSSQTLTTHIYTANSSTGAPQTLLGSSSMTVGTADKFYRTTFSSPVAIAGGQPFFIAFRTTASGFTRPWTASGSNETVYARPASQSAWNGPFSYKPVYRVFFETEAGETVEDSSKGPTGDGRLKPNISAPGRFITSARTKTTNQYLTIQGTSMASPHVAGSAAVMMHRDGPNLLNRPPLVKAQLAAGANPYGGMPSMTASSSTAGFRSWGNMFRQGFGQVDPYKSTYTNPGSKGWRLLRAGFTLTSSSAGGSFDVAVPTTASSMMLVMNYDEPPANLNATRAVLADLDLYIDVAPFTSGFNTGEYSSRRAWDTWEWHTFWTTTTMNAVRGKTVRIKVYPRVRPAVGSTAKVGVALLIYEGDQTPPTTLSLSAPASVKPNQTFTMTATANVPSMMTTNGVIELTKYPGVTVTSMSFTTPDSLTRTYPPILQSTDSLLSWTLGHLYFGQPAFNRLNWSMRRSANGVAQICARLRTDNRVASASTSTYTVCRNVCVDGTLPATVTGLASTTHPLNQWSNKSTLHMSWNTPTDVGCSGILGLATLRSTGSPSTPTVRNLSGAVTSENLTVGSSTSNQYFNIRAVDGANNFSATTATYGPFKVDLTTPTVTSVSINSGAAYTNNLNATVKTTATDTYSGVSRMQFSANGATYSGLQTFTTAAVPINLGSSAIGGNTAEGTKYCYARVLDRAGNTSAAVRDTIIYDHTAPTVTGVVIANGATYTRTLSTVVRITAADSLSGVAQMRFSANGSTWSSWQSYTTANVAINLSANGGNTAQGTKRIYAQVMDRAGNVSVVSTSASDTIVYDSIGPVVTSVVIDNGNAYTQNLNVVVRAVASDAGSGPSQMRYSANGTTYSAYRSYTTANVARNLSADGGNTAQGTKRQYVQVQDAAGNVSSAVFDTIVYDSVAPVITLVQIDNGASHTNSLNVVVKATATDATSGLGDMRYSANGTSWSPFSAYTTANVGRNLTADGGNSLEGTKSQYVQVRDRAGNLSTAVRDTIIYDHTPPVVTLVQINDGAAATSSLNVNVKATGTGTPTEMRYSFDGSTYSSWMSYIATNRGMSMTSFGGNANTGTKSVWVQLRDAANNVSAAGKDNILYFPVPAITGRTPTSVAVVNKTRIRLTGTGFTDVNRIQFGAKSITSHLPDDFVDGWFKVLSDTAIDLFSPQGLPPAAYAVSVRNPAFSSATVNVTIVHNATRTLHVPDQLKVGKTLNVLSHRDGMPAATFDLLTLSLSGTPLAIPGLVSLGHGGNAVTFIDPTFTVIPVAMIHDPTTHVAKWAFPTTGLPAVTLWFESLMFDPLNPSVTPIRTSGADKVKLY